MPHSYTVNTAVVFERPGSPYQDRSSFDGILKSVIPEFGVGGGSVLRQGAVVWFCSGIVAGG